MHRVGQARWVYVSTTGVYGDAGGACFDETRPIAPASERAQRRAAAERELRSFARSGLARASILRVPALYAQHVKGRLPEEQEAAYLDDLRHLPGSVQHALNLEPQVKAWADEAAARHDKRIAEERAAAAAARGR